jgi:tRNA(Ile)-lysidine synthase
MASLPDIARSTATRYDMLPDGAVVLAMVSGGADSVALLRLLSSGELGAVAGLSVLHVNHGLRGEDSNGDEAFVVALCESLGMPCDVVRYDVAEYAEAEGLNLEDAGRRVRYRFAASELDSRCEVLGVPSDRGRVAVAHTFDDRLETFLARLVAGAGGVGLRSIAPTRGRIIRPLLDARRSEVTAYLNEIGQTWREDASNADTTRQRAWVRHELLPLIEQRNPSFDAVSARTLDILSGEDDLLAEMAAAFAHDFSHMDAGALVFDRMLMGTLSRPMARRTVRTALIGAFPEASRLEFEHCEAIVDGMSDDGFSRDLPFGLRVETEYGRLRISCRHNDVPRVEPGLLALPGAVDLGEAGVMEAREAAAGALSADVDKVSIDADRVSWPLVVDSLREGDRIRPFGMEGTKKLGDLLTDEKVPRRLRGAVPIVRDGERVVWVAGVRLAEDCRVTATTARVATLEWRRLDAGKTVRAE